MVRAFLHFARGLGAAYSAFFVLMALAAFFLRSLADEPTYRVTVWGGLLMSGTLLLIGSPGLLVAIAANKQLRHKPEGRGFPVSMPSVNQRERAFDER
jgi:hypothetical protein